VSAGGERPRISACIVAMNEEDRLGDCLRSVAFCDEIVVVDSHSTDGTRELAQGDGARVIERDWAGHVAQKEFAVRAAVHDWVLCVDADERVSPELRAEILALRDAGFPGPAGWRCPRLSNYLGTWVRYGTWYPDLQLRLFDRRRGHWGGTDPHDRVQLEGPAGRLRGQLVHYPYRTLADHLRTIDRYTTIMAEEAYARGRRARSSDLVLRPMVRFARFYLLKRGFLLGWRGLLLAYLAAHYVRLKYAKLLLLGQGRPIGDERTGG
jgi:glycosyltransferase involved in cell wall biosynthesis